ncbi:MAG: hypothetical protein HQ510_00805 [Candidatus Marinimicrobia bacterium]|nr:hypothetical protein [Candidatus Neomarinimicrobiota bacterium]
MFKRNFMAALLLCSLVIAGTPNVSSVVFFDYIYDFTSDANNDAGFAIKRVYFTVTDNLADNLSYKLQTDIDSNNSPKNVYLKNAKVDWKTDLGKITLGLQGMNVFSVQEKTWGYRFIEKSAMDRKKFSSSADMGIGYANKFAQNILFSILYTNGTGYKKSEDDSYKKISAQALIGQPKLSSKEGFNAGGVFTFEPYESDETVTVFGLFGGFASAALRIGGEFDMLTDSGPDVTEQIISVYTVYKLSDKLQTYGRIDIYDPNTDTDEDSENYIIAGIHYSPVTGLIIAPNLRLVTPEEGDSETFFQLNFQFKLK